MFCVGDQQNTATTMRSLPLSSLTVLLLAVACTSFSSIIPSSHSFRYYSFHRLDAESDRREFLSRVGASAFLLATTTTTPSSSAAATSDTSGTVLVLGGTGLVGGEVVKKLKSLGLTVVATSRDGRDGTVAMDFTTTNNVATTIEQLSKGCQSVISCVGAIGTEQDDLINSATGLAAAGAAAAGVDHFVYISVAPEVRAFAKNIDFLNNYMTGKAFSEQSIQTYFGKTGKSYTIIEPTFIYGGDAFNINPPRVANAYGNIVETILSSGPLRAAANIAPEGFIKIALEPPVSATSVADACVAGALGKAPAILDTYDKILAASKLV